MQNIPAHLQRGMQMTTQDLIQQRQPQTHQSSETVHFNFIEVTVVKPDERKTFL